MNKSDLFCIVDSRYIALQVGAGATVGPAPVHDAGAGDAAAGGPLHPGRPLLEQVGPWSVSRGHKHSCCRSHTKLLHPQCKESDA